MSQSATIKQCCAAFYGSDLARMLFGESFHPGGVGLTQRIGDLLGLTPASHVLDVAAGQGTSALHLAKTFGCRVTGIDLSEDNVTAARDAAVAQGLAQGLAQGPAGQVHFALADAERLPFPDATFDAIVCECAFCTFPAKPVAAAEFFRVLRPGGQVGLSDLTRADQPLPDLDGLLAWIACIGDALPLPEYASILTHAGLTVRQTEIHNHALSAMVRDVQSRLLGIEIASGLGKLHIPGLDLSAAKQFATSASHAIRNEELGYAILIACKDAAVSPAIHP